MKTLLVFLAMWVVAMPIVAFLRCVNRGDFKSFFVNYGFGLLTALVMYVTLSFIGLLVL